MAKQTQLLVRIAILDKFSAIVTMDAYPRSQPFLSRQFGPRTPLYCTALGKALLAYFDPDELKEYLKNVELFPYTQNTITKKEQLIKELKNAY